MRIVECTTNSSWLLDWSLYSVSISLKYWTSKNNKKEPGNYSRQLVAKKFVKKFIDRDHLE